MKNSFTTNNKIFKKAILILTLISFPFIGTSQTWIETGATWHYNWSNISSGGFEKIEYIKDTLIDNKLCNKLTPVNYHFVYDQNNILHLISQDTLESRYTYVNGDTVFHIVNDTFEMLYNFGAQPGDTWNFYTDPNSSQCGPSGVLVDSIGTININNTNYRWIALSSLPNSRISIEGKVIEYIGAMEDYLFPSGKNCDDGIAIEFNQYDFSCYEDDNFPLYNISNRDCEYYLLVSGISELESTYRFHPNPTQGNVHISRSSNSEIEIKVHNSTGKEVYSVFTTKNEIDLNLIELNEGVYFIRIEDGQNQMITKKVVKL